LWPSPSAEHNWGAVTPIHMQDAEGSRRWTIHTPDQRLRVFVSSTLNKLAPERVAARQAIAQLRLIPVMFEAGAPAPTRRVTRTRPTCHRARRIHWRRYGWVGPDQKISGLEDEYLLSRGKPSLFYVKALAPDRELLVLDNVDIFWRWRQCSLRGVRAGFGALVRPDYGKLLGCRRDLSAPGGDSARD